MSKENNNEQMPQEEVYQSILGDEIPLDEEFSDTPEESGSDSEASAKPKASKKKVLTIVGVSAASVALVGCLTFAGVGIFNKQRQEKAVTTANETLNSQVFACYYHDILQMMIASNGEEVLLTNYGLDVNKSLKEQNSPLAEGSTWFDLVVEQTQGTLEQQLVMYEAANAAGFTIPESDQALVDQALAEADIASYGNNVTEEDLRKALEIQALSTAYYSEILEELTPDDAEIEAYYEANPKNFMTCGLAGFSISYQTESDTEAPLTQEEAEGLANQLADAANPKEFEEIVSEILLNYEDYTQEEVDTNLPSIYNGAYTYTENNELAEWAFGGAKVNETYMLEGMGTYYIYMMTDEPDRDESTTINVRHILISSAEDNMAAAEEILAEWESGDKTEESFGELAGKYTEDPGSSTTGGLYTGVAPGQMVQPFNDWCFDSSRKVGDTGLVETDFGVHVMYFSGNSEPMWKTEIKTILQQENYNKWYTEQQALYPVTFNTAAINSIDG